MSIELEPAELGFRRPLTREVVETLHIRNPNSRPIIFKVKTTAPRRYCVRPNSGRIEPGRHMEVQVLLQGMKDEPPLDTKCKDKFLVLSVVVTADQDFSNIASIWQEVERMAKPTIQERKIRVNYLPAESPDESLPEQPNGAAPYEDQPPAYTTPVAVKYETPATTRTAKLENSPSPPHEYERSKSPAASSAAVEETPRAATTAAATDAHTLQPLRDSKSTEDLVGQLAEARLQVQKLKQQVANNELRQPKVGGDSNTESGSTGESNLQTLPPQPTEGGVPLQVVAILCLISFLLAYVFF